MDIEIKEVQEIIKNLESSSELSIKEEKYLNVAKLCVQLAAENVALKAACGGDGSYRNCPACTFSEYIEAPETPVTDRIVAVIKSDGVEEFAESQKEYVRQHRNEMDQVLRAAYAWSAVGAERFAKQLREGAK